MENVWKMTDDDWEILLYTITRGRCILMLGPDIPTEDVEAAPTESEEADVSAELEGADAPAEIEEEDTTRVLDDAAIPTESEGADAPPGVEEVDSPTGSKGSDAPPGDEELDSPTQKTRLRKPLMEILANKIADDLENETDGRIKIGDVDRNNLAYVAQKYAAHRTPTRLQPKSAAFYKNGKFQQSQVHANLAALPFYLIINATPDRLIVEALKERQQKKYVVDYYNFRRVTKDKADGRREEVTEEGTPDRPLVYYLYGSVEEPESLVLSENDLLDFLVAIIKNEPPLHNNIKSEFGDERKCFLFLGFGFRNWYLRILLHVLQGDKRVSPSFALEPFAAPDDPAFRRAKIFFKDEYRLHIYSEDLEAFARELKQRYQQNRDDQTQREERAELFFGDPPSAFICHAGENKEYAVDLYDKLERRGIKPWIDVEDIHGGARWDDHIKKTLEEIDYVIVLESEALWKKGKSKNYVNREINIALEIATQFGAGTDFIIPVQIDAGERRKELKHLQTIDLREPNGFERLVSTIQRDYKNRS